jgi:hypothetical protein
MGGFATGFQKPLLDVLKLVGFDLYINIYVELWDTV